jgi:HEAT repeat protein
MRAIGASILVLAYCLANGGAAQVKNSTKEKEPEFKGRTLSQWVEQLKSGGAYERQEAVLALHELGPGAVPALAEALLKEKEVVNVRIWAAWGLRLNGPAAKAAVPQLKAALQDDLYLVSIEAAKALWVISKDKTTIPSVVKFLKSKNAGIRWSAAEHLGWFGPSAKEAVPALLEALKDTGVVEMTDKGKVVGGKRVHRIVEIRSVKTAAGKALKRIDPEAAKKAGVK